MFQSWTQISRGKFGGIVFFDGNAIVQFTKIDNDGNFNDQQAFGGVFPATAILAPGPSAEARENANEYRSRAGFLVGTIDQCPRHCEGRAPERRAGRSALTA